MGLSPVIEDVRDIIADFEQAFERKGAGYRYGGDLRLIGDQRDQKDRGLQKSYLTLTSIIWSPYINRQVLIPSRPDASTSEDIISL